MTATATLRRYPAAGGDVPRVRRHLLRPRSHPSDGRAGGARSLRGVPHQPRADLRSSRNGSGAAAELRMSAVELLDATLRASGKGTWEEAAARGWVDCAESFEASHFLEGFPSADGRFHFKPDWAAVGPYHAGMKRAARPPRELRARNRGPAVPPRRAAGARLPQHDLHRDAGIDEARGRAAGADPRGRRGPARPVRRQLGAARQ